MFYSVLQQVKASTIAIKLKSTVNVDISISLICKSEVKCQMQDRKIPFYSRKLHKNCEKNTKLVFYGTLISVIYILKSDDNVTLKDFEYD